MIIGYCDSLSTSGVALRTQTIVGGYVLVVVNRRSGRCVRGEGKQTISLLLEKDPEYQGHTMSKETGQTMAVEPSQGREGRCEADLKGGKWSDGAGGSDIHSRHMRWNETEGTWEEWEWASLEIAARTSC